MNFSFGKSKKISRGCSGMSRVKLLIMVSSGFHLDETPVSSGLNPDETPVSSG